MVKEHSHIDYLFSQAGNIAPVATNSDKENQTRRILNAYDAYSGEETLTVKYIDDIRYNFRLYFIYLDGLIKMIIITSDSLFRMIFYNRKFHSTSN